LTSKAYKLQYDDEQILAKIERNMAEVRTKFSEVEGDFTSYKGESDKKFGDFFTKI